MDLTTALGLSMACIVVALIVIFQGSISFYWNLEAFVITFGGTFTASLLNTPWNILISVIRSSFLLLFPAKYNACNIVPLMKKLSEKAKKEGVFSLKGEGKAFSDEFLEKGITLLGMNDSPHSIKKMLENEIVNTKYRHKSIINVVRTMGLYAPVFGLFGTLVGVIQVLMKIGSPTEVGPAMATAVMASVYGILLAYFIFHPIAGKLRLRDDEEILAKAMIVEGLLLIQEGKLPSVIERHMLSYIYKQPGPGK